MARTTLSKGLRLNRYDGAVEGRAVAHQVEARLGLRDVDEAVFVGALMLLSEQRDQYSR
jgi:hypothetical protein